MTFLKKLVGQQFFGRVLSISCTKCKLKSFKRFFQDFVSLKIHQKLTNFDAYHKITVLTQKKCLTGYALMGSSYQNTKQIPLPSRATLETRCQNEINPQLRASNSNTQRKTFQRPNRTEFCAKANTSMFRMLR